jgi:putative ABC transport system permease protein
MIKNNLKTSWRNLFQNKIFSLIKIIGLSLGLTVCMIIFLYIKDEISYDRFHVNSSMIFRIITTTQAGDMPPHTGGTTNGATGESISNVIPEVQNFIRMNKGSVIVKNNNDSITEPCLFVDDNFFLIFTFPLTEGNPKIALAEPNSVVLSENLAKKYFSLEGAFGKTLQIKRNNLFENYKVTAITENLPQNSSIKADMFFPIGNFRGNVNTFLQLSPQANPKAVENKIQELFEKSISDQAEKSQKEQGIVYKASRALQPLSDIHFNHYIGPGSYVLSDESDPVYAYVLTCVAAFILIIACINFINLSVAQSLKRSKEVGVRKVAGGTRTQLIRQFLSESFLASFIAFFIAIFLTLLILPFFNDLANKKLSFSYLSDWYLYIGYLGLFIITTFAAGFYPSLILSSYQPVKVLYGRLRLMSKNYFTKSLFVLQFALTAFLILVAIAVNSQVHFLLNKNLGYDSENLVKIDLPHNSQTNLLVALLKNELSIQNNFTDIAVRNGGRVTSGVNANGKSFIIDYNVIDDKFLPMLKIPVIEGRNFSSEFPSDLSSSIIINEAFAKAAEWKPNEAIGKTLNFMDAEKSPATIIGVIKDYNFASLKEEITAQVFTMNLSRNYGQLWVRLNPGNKTETLTSLQKTFAKLVPGFNYSYQVVEDINAGYYVTESKWKLIINISSVLFILISCIGLFGLVMLSIEQRTKEIGIRKVFGTPVSGIIRLMTKDFIILILIANVITVPVAYYFINKWLQIFPYRINVTMWMFVLPGIFLIALALSTMSFQVTKASLANPVNSLRTE